jgi:hypothetical protein
MRPWSDALAGIVVGGFLALAYLLAGPLILIPGFIIWGWALARHRSLPATAATLIGFRRRLGPAHRAGRLAVRQRPHVRVA